MNTDADCWQVAGQGGVRFFARRTLLVLMIAVASGMACTTALADNFANVYYDAQQDQLVVTMLYNGTNPDHVFSLRWGQCRVNDGGEREIVAEVLDDQWRDAAR